MNIVKNIKNIAQEVLLNESPAIENLIQLIDNDFGTCVKEIYSLKGRVIVTGIGKSAIIANKIVTTLNTIGIPAVFMHAADAIRSDLGVILKQDFVIGISKSGIKPEIKVHVPMLKLKRRVSKLVALVSYTNSYRYHFVFNEPIMEETCPNKWASITSAAVYFAPDDGQALGIQGFWNFTCTSFVQNHDLIKGGIA